MFTKADIEKYFIAEKSASFAFVIIGVVAIVLALVFFFYLKTNWYKGVAIPFIIIGLLHVTAAYTVYKNCDEGRKKNVYAYDMNPDQLKNNELPRMEKVRNNFKIFKALEVALLLLGINLFFYFRHNADNTFWAGFGVALAIEAAITFGFDFTGDKNATKYTNGLQSFIHTPVIKNQ